MDLFKDELNIRIDFFRGFGKGIVDLVKGLKAPLEITMAISPTIPLPLGVRAALLIDGTNELYQGAKVFVKDPENAVGAIFQGMADTADEEGAAFTVGYSVEKVVEIVLAKKLAEKVKGPKGAEGAEVGSEYIGKKFDGCRNLEADFVNGKGQSTLAKHAGKHGYATDTTRYIEDARKFLDSEPSPTTQSFMSEEGTYFRYDVKTNEFGIINQYGGISTYFKPVDGLEYWLEQIEKYAPK